MKNINKFTKIFPKFKLNKILKLSNFSYYFIYF